MAWLDRFRGSSSHILDRTLNRAGSFFHRPIPVIPAGAILVLAGAGMIALGCGNQYRPVITPIQPTGPAPAPSADAVIVSQPGFSPLAPGVTGPCTANTYATPSVITVMDFSGDSVEAQANAGYGPIGFSLETGGANVYAPNCDGTLTTALSTPTQLKTSNVQTSTLLPGSIPTNTLSAGSNLYVTEAGLHGPTCLATNCVAQLTSTGIQSLKQEIPVAPSLINLTGFAGSLRIYAISQGNSGGGTQPKWGDCANPASVTVNGEADAIETETNTISARLPLGICPVYGFTTPDTLRSFIMNRGSGTVTVINAQLNALDTTSPNLGPHATIPVGAGPVFADYYRQGEVLVTANYDSNTISIIDVSLDVYGNDSTTFGKVLATIPVGLHPVEVSVLQDGSRVYVANQGDIAAGTPGSVSVVNLTNYTVEKTIPLTSNPHAIVSIYNYPIGKVYVTSQNSPYLTIIRTDTDIISATPELQGNILDIRVSAQYPGQSANGSSNYQIESRSVGSGAP
jgi:DNA-binding beta-propeller fold protein YncE